MTGALPDRKKISKCEASGCKKRALYKITFWNGAKLYCEEHADVVKEFGQSAQEMLR